MSKLTSSEAVWLTARATGSQDFDILTVDRLAGNDHEVDAQLLDELKVFATRPNTFLVRDVNGPTIDWNSASANCSETAVDQQLL
ncbi:unnamed protein product [Schistocephalus solidus]|uniref:ATP-binding protein n=1 Tax=Schistocephalus solidus TaxID=70667 RepID=A0A183TCF8_SCHSO|nr:unnamed protein product [Schistocephalus solidus]